MKVRFEHELNGRTLSCYKLDKDDRRSEPMKITAGVSNRKHGAKSVLSYFVDEPHFLFVRKSVNHEIAELSNEQREHFRPQRDAIMGGLHYVGHRVFSCEIPPKHDKDRMLWLCPSKHKHLKVWVEVIVIDMIHHDRPFRSAPQNSKWLREHSHEFRKLERESKALLRFAYVVFKNTQTLVPGLLRKDGHHD